MSIYTPINKNLTDIITEYQRKVRDAYFTSEVSMLAPQDMDTLALTNARAIGAKRAQETIREIVGFSGLRGELSKQAEMDALPQIIREIESNIDTFLRMKDTHVETFRVLIDVRKALQLEQYA